MLSSSCVGGSRAALYVAHLHMHSRENALQGCSNPRHGAQLANSGLCIPACCFFVVAGFAPFSIRSLLQFDLLEQLPKLQVVSAAASKEAALEKALSNMQADWQGVEFHVVEYKDTGTYVIGGTDEVQVRSLTCCCHCLPQPCI